jgi:molecular chaperone GrpE (heat shock protein)
MAESSPEVSQQLEDIRKALAERSQAETTQQQAFDSLYEELRQYKEDFIFQAEKPLLLDLLLFYDSLNWFQKSLQDDEMSAEVIADSFQYLIDEFLEVLYRRDVLPMESKVRFDRKTQKVVKLIETADPDEDQTVAQVLKRGFTRAARVLRAEEITLNRHQNK